MRSLIAFGLAVTTASAALAGGGGGAHGGGGSMGGGFHGGGSMGGGSHWGGTPTIPLNAPGSHGGMGGGYGGGGGHGGGGHWVPGGGHGGWHPGSGKPGGWHHPGRPGHWGGHYRRPFRGWRVPSFFLGGGFFLNDWWDFGLSQPPYGYNWVRYYDDAVLVDGSGTISDARYGLNWGDDEGFAGGEGSVGEMDAGGPPPPMMPGGPQPMMQGGPQGAFGAGYDRGYDDGFRDGEDSVTWGGHWRSGGAMMQNGYGSTHFSGYAVGGTHVFAGPGGASVVVVQGPPTVTTTTTTTEEIVYAAPRRVWRAKPKRAWHKPACSCRCYCR